jgi:transposase
VSRVVIGVDPHKASNTLVVIDAQERVLAQQRFANDRAGYRSMKTFARAHRERVWAVEGARGVGAGLAQRLVADGEPVLDVPARLSARVRALGGGSGRKTDDADAFAVAVAGLRARDLQVVRQDDSVEILRLLSTRRQMVGRFRSVGVDEFVLYWPGSWPPDAAHEHRVFEQVTTEAIPALRAEQSRGVSQPGA